MICFAQFPLQKIRDSNRYSCNRLINGSQRTFRQWITGLKFHLISLIAPGPQLCRIHQGLTPPNRLAPVSALSTRLIQSHKQDMAQASLIKRQRWTPLRVHLCLQHLKRLIMRRSNLYLMINYLWIGALEVVVDPISTMTPQRFRTLSMEHLHIIETLRQVSSKARGMHLLRKRSICQLLLT